MSVIKSISTYTFVGFFTTGISFLVMPILTHYLTPAEYGILSLFNIYVSLLTPFIGLLAGGLILVEYFNKDMSDLSFKSLFSSITLLPIVTFSIILFITYIFKSYLAGFLKLQEQFVLFIPVIALLAVYRDQILNFWVTEKKQTTYAVANILRTISEIGLTLFFIVYLSYGWDGRIYSLLVTTAIFSAYGLCYFYNKKLLTFQFNLKYIKAGLAYGLPLILHTLSKTIINQSDRLFIAKMVSVEETGIYSTGYLVGSIILILSTAFGLFYSPYMYKNLSGKFTYEERIKTVRITYGFIIFLFISLFIVTFLANFLFTYFIDINYSNGLKYVFWIGLGYFFWGVYVIFSTFIFYFRKTQLLAYLALLSIVTNIALNYVLISAYGTIGAAYATTISFFIISVIIVVISNTIYKMPWLNFKTIIWGR